MTTKSVELVGKELLLEVACDLFMKSGYDGVSMQQIAEAAHMTKGSPYYHFKGKEDLFAQAFRHRTARLTAGLADALAHEGDIRQRLIAAATYLLSAFDGGMIQLIEDYKRREPELRGSDDPAFNPEAVLGLYVPIFAEAAATMPLRIAPQRAAIAYFAMQMGTLHAVHLTGELASDPAEIERLAAETVDTFLYGVVAPAVAEPSLSNATGQPAAMPAEPTS